MIFLLLSDALIGRVSFGKIFEGGEILSFHSYSHFSAAFISHLVTPFPETQTSSALAVSKHEHPAVHLLTIPGLFFVNWKNGWYFRQCIGALLSGDDGSDSISNCRYWFWRFLCKSKSLELGESYHLPAGKIKLSWIF